MDQANTARAITLTLKGPLHVGEFVGVSGEGAREWTPSDTLFGALISAWAAQGQDVTTLLDGFVTGCPPFLLSSAFPHAGEMRFYPRPWLVPHPSGVLGRKRGKRLRWVSAGVFERLVKGASLAGETDNDLFIQGGTVWITRAERDCLPEVVLKSESGRIWGYQAAPRVTVDRASSSSNLFHSGRVDFAPGCGLWFALRFLDPDPAWPERVRTALNYLQDAGLGGLRSIGHGAFTWAWKNDPCPIPPPQAGEGEGKRYAITLSRYAPRDADELRRAMLDGPHAAYRLETVGGWCQDDALHPWRRRSVRVVTEGSLLAWDGHAALGHLVDVTPEQVGAFGPGRRVYRYGYAFPASVSAQALDIQEGR